MIVSDMNCKQLQTLAREYGIPDRSKMRKQELIKAIEDFHNLDNAFAQAGSACALPKRKEIDQSFGLKEQRQKSGSPFSNRARKRLRFR